LNLLTKSMKVFSGRECLVRTSRLAIESFDKNKIVEPLIRKFVNAVLVEHDLEGDRHKLTRVGLPIYDVTHLMKRWVEDHANH